VERTRGEGEAGIIFLRTEVCCCICAGKLLYYQLSMKRASGALVIYRALFPPSRSYLLLPDALPSQLSHAVGLTGHCAAGGR